ncbi:DNA-binding SARP family transcriptional activator [Amycolatopsis sulphurea]|uniref:DNA-binding SARP family transcriptional activator n=1 Tax=Amycolatopsis sulphurea TaxID=76022 RepID=A0A2A9G0M2_9PSEU|nr:BTAD domain-containing putative transcriptional regulator [Amycolatopsis sulphurea]PFG56978.1 DNA-binding SARP family transcriptional activator [Amycolatopsis sulphurea]
MDFSVLGPVRASVDGRPVDVGVRKQRFVLAVLLLEVNKHVPADRLIELAWPEGEAPDTARTVIHTQISRLRATFAGSEDVALVREGSGYQLRVDPMRVDVFRFHALCAQARAATDECRIKLLEEALALWAGPALSSVASEEIRLRMAAPLEEARLGALEDRFEAYLRRGEEAGILPELAEAAAEHPLRQQLVAKLMLALHRLDRTPEALAAYQRLYRRLDEELGIEPAPAVRQLQVRILRDDPSLLPFTGPRQLPPEVDHYTGRHDHLDTLAGLFGLGDRVPAVVAITGKPGLGKTALAIRAAHGLASRFPDGQLFVDLHGAGPRPRDPAEVLARFLRDLGVAGADLPASLEERMGLFRDRTATRGILVVLDNAADEEQVRSLIPGNPECGVLITSRRRLTGLDLRGLIDLDGLADTDAFALLSGLAPRVRAEDEAAGEVVRLCGGLPLALRIVGAKLRSHPHQTVADLAARMTDERDRLDELVGGDREVRASFLLSYDGLTLAQQRAFRLLAAMPDTGFAAWAAAAALGEDLRTTQRVLDSLVDVNLLECGRGEFTATRYHFHDLIRLYAKEKLSPPEGAAVWSRLTDAYLYLGKRADAQLEFGGLHQFTPPPLAVDAPRLAEDVDRNAAAWLADEHTSIVQAVELSAAAGDDATTCRLSATVAAFLELRAQWRDLQRVAELSHIAATRMDSPYWTAYALFALGLAARETRDFATSARSFRAGLEILPRADDPLLEVVVLLSVGVSHRLQGRWDEAAAHFAGCLSRLDSLAAPRWRAYTLREYGVLHRYRGEWAKAKECLTEAIAAYHTLGDVRWEAASGRELGIVHQDEGDHAAAVEQLTASREALRNAGDDRREGAALRCLGWVALEAGNLAEALAYARQAREILDQARDPHGLACAEVLLGDVHLALGDSATGRAHLDRGVAYLDTSGDPRWRGKSVLSLGRHLAAAGDLPGARAAWEKAWADLSRIGAHEAATVRALLDG